MGTLVQKIAKFKQSQEAVRSALSAEGIVIPIGTPFSQWYTYLDTIAGLDWDGSITSVSIRETPDVTHIRKFVFAGCANLHTLTIPLNITTIDAQAFTHSSLTEVTFSGRTKSQVQGVSAVIVGYPWGLSSGTVIKCTDGDITVSA